MLRSVTLKVLLLYGLVTVIGVGIVTTVALLTITSRFDTLRAEQTLRAFRAEAAAYYAASDTLEGFQPVEERAAGLVLVDSAGQVVVGSGAYQAGARLSAQQVAAGLPVIVAGNRVGTVRIFGDAPPSDPIQQMYITDVTRALLLAMAVALLVMLVGGWLLRGVLRPLQHLTVAAAEVQRGYTPRPIRLTVNDQFAEIALAINMLALQLERDLHQRRLMTANIAHDLRTPLSVISGYLEGMIDGMLAPTPERLKTMLGEADQLRHLIEDFRTVTLSETGELKLLIRPVEPAVLLRQISSAFQPLAETQGITLQVHAASGLPVTTMDRERMAQVLANLVSNALRYTDHGGSITLSTYVESGLHFVVADTGAGIPPDKLPHIFERSYQAESRRSGSAGLGLAIARTIVEAHEGSIRAESAPGKGTVMTVTLPAGYHHAVTPTGSSSPLPKLPENNL